jgi:hypothetical protein
MRREEGRGRREEGRGKREERGKVRPGAKIFFTRIFFLTKLGILRARVHGG